MYKKTYIIIWLIFAARELYVYGGITPDMIINTIIFIPIYALVIWMILKTAYRIKRAIVGN